MNKKKNYCCYVHVKGIKDFRSDALIKNDSLKRQHADNTCSLYRINLAQDLLITCKAIQHYTL